VWKGKVGGKGGKEEVAGGNREYLGKTAASVVGSRGGGWADRALRGNHKQGRGGGKKRIPEGGKPLKVGPIN